MNQYEIIQYNNAPKTTLFKHGTMKKHVEITVYHYEYGFSVVTLCPCLIKCRNKQVKKNEFTVQGTILILLLQPEKHFIFTRLHS